MFDNEKNKNNTNSHNNCQYTGTAKKLDFVTRTQNITAVFASKE